MTRDIGTISISGLSELRRQLRAIDTQAPKGLRDVGNKAAELIVAVAKPRVPIGPAAGGHAASSIRAASTRTAGRVRAGGKRFSYFPWLDFGGKVGRNDSATRPFLTEGRYVWAAYADERDQVEDKLRAGLRDVARSAGVRVKL